MEKLIELLNEYEMGNDNYSGVISEGDVYYYSVLYISKKFGFIKWLVENDKINVEKLRDLDIADNFCYEYFNKNKSDFLISLLSISDTPIDDLVLYLK